jgi:glycosyltransferase involved in cell wall biosynthesis
MPRVSLAMPVYNGENYVAEALDSILAQDFADFELIITDNASTDSTEAICRDYARRDPRIRYHRHPRNLGAAPNYNSGYELATGEYLKWCAHDDRISANYLSECVRLLDADPQVALAFGRTQCIDGAGAPLRARHPLFRNLLRDLRPVPHGRLEAHKPASPLLRVGPRAAR